MKKNVPSHRQKLALRVETLRNLSADEMGQVNGGFNWACSSVFIPSSGITLTYPIITTYCD